MGRCKFALMGTMGDSSGGPYCKRTETHFKCDGAVSDKKDCPEWSNLKIG